MVPGDRPGLHAQRAHQDGEINFTRKETQTVPDGDAGPAADGRRCRPIVAFPRPSWRQQRTGRADVRNSRLLWLPLRDGDAADARYGRSAGRPRVERRLRQDWASAAKAVTIGAEDSLPACIPTTSNGCGISSPALLIEPMRRGIRSWKPSPDGCLRPPAGAGRRCRPGTRLGAGDAPKQTEAERVEI